MVTKPYPPGIRGKRRKGGLSEYGRRRFNQYARIATVPLAALQGYGMLTLLQRQGAISFASPEVLISAIITVTAGTVFLMWLGELITEKGIGNGVSLLIFAGIVARLPSNIRQSLLTWSPSQLPSYIFFVFAVFLIPMIILSLIIDYLSLIID